MFKYGGSVMGLDHLRGFILNTKPHKRPIRDAYDSDPSCDVFMLENTFASTIHLQWKINMTVKYYSSEILISISHKTMQIKLYVSPNCVYLLILHHTSQGWSY
jgi:hypothetical protein